MKGIGFSGLLAILFIAFKLAGIIDWSWVWVLAPLWLGLALFVAGIGIYFLVILLSEFIKSKRVKKRNIKRFGR